MKRCALLLHALLTQQINRKSIMKTLLLLTLNLFTFFNFLSAQEKTKTDSVKMQQLQEVTIKSKTPVVQVKTDKTILNVDAMANTAGLNVLDLLRQAPGVSVDGQEQIKMSGKSGVQVLVEGRLQTMSMQQITSMLKGMDAANIKSIEVIANPSAKYDAAGNAGIINIIFKKSTQNGTNGSISAGYAKMDHYRNNAAFNLNNKSGKFNIFIHGNYDNSLQFTKVNNNRFIGNTAYLRNGIERQGYENPGFRVGTDVNLNAKHKIGTVLSYNRVWDDFPSDASTLITGDANDLLSTSTIANLTENRFASNLNYQFTDTSGNTLAIETDYLNYTAKLVNNVNNVLRNNSSTSLFSNNTDLQINLFSAKADANTKLKNGNWENGIKFSASTTNNILKTSQQENQGNPFLQFNDFDYKERIIAGYSSLNKSFKKWNLQAGLRAEYTNMQGLTVNEKQEQISLPDTAYLNIFPTFFARYNATDNHSLGFAYNRRIDRPSFQDQNPYVYRVDLYNTYNGNPLLLPQFTQSFEVDFTYKGQMQLKLKYSQSRDLIEFVSTQTADQTNSLPINAGVRSFINLAFNTPFKAAKFWSGYFYAEPYYQFYKADLSAYNGLARINNGGPGFNSYISNNFDLGKKWEAELSNWFNYASRSSIYKTKAISSLDVAVKKQLMNDKLTLRLTYRDIFNTQRWFQSAQIGQVNQTSLRKWESQGAFLNLSYRFGNQKIKSADSNKGKTEEQGRIKSRG